MAMVGISDNTLPVDLQPLSLVHLMAAALAAFTATKTGTSYAIQRGIKRDLKQIHFLSQFIT